MKLLLNNYNTLFWFVPMYPVSFTQVWRLVQVLLENTLFLKTGQNLKTDTQYITKTKFFIHKLTIFTKCGKI